MITKYDDYWKFLQDVRNLKNTIVLVPAHFKNHIGEMSTANYKQLMTILKTNNIKVWEMRPNVRSDFKAK